MAETELELKLSVPEDDLARLRRDPLIHRTKISRARSVALVAVYFDTADLSLRGERIGLRLRQEGPHRIQTLKLSNGGAGLQRRIEFNAPTDSDHPKLELIDDTTMRAKIAGLLANTPLQAIFTTDIRRTLWTVQIEQSVIELALDIGKIESNGRKLRVAEIELELKSGDPRSIFAFAEQLSQRYNIHVHDQSKAARGYQLYCGTAPPAVRASKLQLDRDESIWTTLGRVIEDGSSQLFANEAAIRSGNEVEGIHQARVAVRRMRAALTAFRDILPEDLRKSLAKPLQKLQVELGPARDWDVFLTETLYPLREESALSRSLALEKFIKRVEEARRRAYRTSKKALKKPWYGKLQLALIQFPYLAPPNTEASTSTEAAAGTLLDQRLRQVLHAAGSTPLDLPEEDLHAIRIDIKKLRYAFDVFRSLYPTDSVSPWRRASKQLQDCLGGLNDTVVQAALLDSMEAPDRPIPKAVRKAVLRRNAESAQRDLENFQACWAKFSDLNTFWRGDPKGLKTPN